MSRPIFSGLQTQPRPLRLAGAFSIAKGSATSRLYRHGKSTESYSGGFERGNHVAYPVAVHNRKYFKTNSSLQAASGVPQK